MIYAYTKAAGRIIFILLFLPAFAIAQQINPPFIFPEANRWADSVLHTLSYEEKIGQLFTVASRSDGEENQEEIASLICDQHIGGIMFLKGSPARQARLTNYYQHLSKIPLLISIDGEWGLNMRLDSTTRFPRQMTLGAMANDTLIYTMGAEIARQCQRLGIHVNFAPDIDINNNPLNPVINSRAFGEDKEQVAHKGWLYMKGLQDNRILACGKHFPGHGNTDTDSHFALPLISESAEEIDTVELVPFKRLIDRGIGAIMVAHLYIPALDTVANRSSALSPVIVNDLLKEKLNYRGLIFTDALNMKGVSSYYAPGDIEIKALEAGNDVLLFSDNIPHAVEQVHFAIQNCLLDQEEIDEKVRKILKAKYWAGLNNYNPVAYPDLTEELNTPEAQWLNYRLYRDAMTVLINKKETLPVKEVKNKIASLVINDSLENFFQIMLRKYALVDMYKMPDDSNKLSMDSLYNQLKKYDYVILSIHNTSTKAFLNFGISGQVNEMIKNLSSKCRLIVCLFGNSYSLTRIPDATQADAVIISYEDTYLPQLLTSQLIFGSMGANGTLPVSPSADFIKGAGLTYPDFNLRLQYTLPEDENIPSEKFKKIDSLVNNAITAHAFPGCQVLAAYNGKVIFEKTYGYKTYDSLEAVKVNDLYDIASVTKVAATALAAMKLYENGELDLYKKISKYLPEFKNSNKKDIILIDMLAHQAGLKSWVPFYKKTLDEAGVRFHHIYNNISDEGFPGKVADSIFIQKDYDKIMWKEIISSPLGEKGKYIYSDMGLLIMQRIIEKISGKTLEEYVYANFYRPMGLHHILFNPLEKGIQKDKIIPTENDTIFRKQVIHGYVHDPAAAMLGGVAGHAGLFSDASSLGVIMQMLLQGGEYGGQRYLKPETIGMFTKRQFPEGANRRGLIFDKPEPDPEINGPSAKSASPSAFGHAGFTGTCAWADPEHKMVYIFLSNRVYPDASNNKLALMNIRTDIMEIIYDAKK